MSNRITVNQSEHDEVVKAAAQIYYQKGLIVIINPDGEKNEDWRGRYIDIIAKTSQSATSAWITEIETADSVSDTEAEKQWVDYDSVYSIWHLAVPIESENTAKELLRKNRIQHCNIITWYRNSSGVYIFSGLPGI